MDRLAQSPLRLALNHREKHKLQRKKLQYVASTDDEGPTDRAPSFSPTSRKRRLLRPLEQRHAPQLSDKTRREYEAALLRRDFQRVLLMVENGDVPVSYETLGGETALLAAVAAKREHAFRFVMKCGVCIDGHNRHGYTPLMKAIAAAAPFAEASAMTDEHMPRRQKKRSSTSASDNREEDDEHQVFDNRMVACVLAHMPDLYRKDNAGCTAFDWATRTRNTEAIHMMKAYQRSMRAQHQDFSDREGRKRECEALLARHDVIAAEAERLVRMPLLQEPQLMQFLHSTPSDLTEESVRSALIEYHVLTTHEPPFVRDFFLDRETHDGWTPLTKAAACGFIESVQLLLQMGADPERESRRLKHTALTWASLCGHENVVLALLRHGVQVNCATQEGKTPLMHAISNQQRKIVRHLLREMHDRCVMRASGKEAFHYSEAALIQMNNPSPTRRPSRWGKRPVSTATGKRKPGTEEWHLLFLEMLQVKDSAGQDAAAYAQEPGECPELAQAIEQEIRDAVAHANEHKAYVALHQSRMMPSPCGYAADGCDFVAPLDLLPTHELHECRKRRVTCEQCGEQVVFEARAQHDASRCMNRLVPCVNRQFGCDAVVVYAEREAHERDHCRKRLVRCRLGCDNKGGPLKYDERDVHESTQCVLRLVECPMQCGAAPFPANQSGKHMRKECAKRPVQCVSGCGMLIPLDTMRFHVVTLCEKRKIACKWAKHGCGATIGGSIESRRHHEERECPYRWVRCKHAGCQVGGELLACFEGEHYAWQCSLEHVTCPHDCGEEPMPRHLADAHTLGDAGGCRKRLTRCRLDLCGKMIRLYDTDDESRAALTSDVGAADGEGRPSMRALAQRWQRAKAFLNTLQKASGTEKSDAAAGPEYLTNETTRQTLLTWLESLCAQLENELTQVEARKLARMQRVRVLSFNPETTQHLLEFQRDGCSTWLSLHGREYDVESPGDASLPTGLLNTSAIVFRCGYLPAESLHDHESDQCELRLVPCPLKCGQKLPSQAIAQHLAKRCNLRNATCRLGCGAVQPFVSLRDHEDAQCVLRQVTCEYCHTQMPQRSLVVHLASHCSEIPRRCRLGCPLKLPSAQFESHEKHDCPMRLVACPQCEKRVWFSETQSHLDAECALRVVGECDAGCGRVLRYHERAHHLLYDCIMRQIVCPQCHASLRWKELAQHKALLCPHRGIFCRHGCGAKIEEIDAAAHEEEHCEKRLVFCPNRCGQQLPHCALHEHTSLHCDMRVVACPHDCGDRLFAYQCESHWRRCRQRLCECGVGSRHCARPIRLWIHSRKLVRCKTHGESALLWALKTQDEDLVTYFLSSTDVEQDQDGVNIEFANGFTALGVAASLGSLELAKLLLRHGADVNQESSRGRTPLMEACMAREPAMVCLLLAHRASVGHVNRHGVGVLSVAESYAASEKAEESRSKEVLRLLKEQLELENDQRELFRAVACSDYDYVAQLLRFSAGMTASGVARADELEHVVNEKEVAYEAVKHELDDSVALLNDSIADAEAKTTQTQRLRERVDDCQTQVAKIESFHDKSVAESNALEAEMLAHIREITAIDIAKLLNTNTPPDAYLVVMKSICMFCGVMPRGRRNASEYTDLEWWKTAQALLMDRSLLSKLRGYRNQTVTPDVMAKVRRECLRTQAFAASTKAIEALVDTGEDEQDEDIRQQRNKSVLPRRDALRGDIVGTLATWVKGVEMEYKAHHERQTLVDKKRRLAVTLHTDEKGLSTALFDMQVATRSLPARQDEVQRAKAKLEVAEKELKAAKQRLRAYKLLQYAALNGHTALTFACSVGNEAMVHMLLTHGACAGATPEEKQACAALIQLTFKEFLYRTKQRKKLEAAHRSRSDEAVEALVRNVAQTFLTGHYMRKRREVLHTHRVALHEAVYSGFSEVVEILLAHEDVSLWQRTHVFPMRTMPAAPWSCGLEGTETKRAKELRRRGGWRLVPLTGEREKASNDGEGDARAVEARLAPMTIEETLSHALYRTDCRTFRREDGGWTHEKTKLSDTHAFMTKLLTRMKEAQQTQRQEIRARKNVAKKTTELKALHAQLETAIVRREFKDISKLLDDGALADYETSGDGLTALMAACIEERYVENSDGSHVLAVEFLLDRQTNRPFVNFESSSGQTALSVAAANGTTLCAQALVERGANVNVATRRRGETALMVAARHGQREFVEFMLRHKETDVFVKDFQGRTAFDHAHEAGFSDVQRVLGAAMGGGLRGRVFSIENALYGVCKWGCGFMTPTRGHNVDARGDVVADTHPLETHEREGCPKRIVPCPLECDAPTLWAEAVETHVKSECPQRRVLCSQPKCGALVVSSRLHVHDSQECAFRMVLCVCGERMTHQKHVVHSQNQCVERLVRCPNQCSSDSDTKEVTLVKFADLKDHTRSVCTHRRVRCRNGCAASDLLFKDREHHETTQCVLRRVACKWGCDEPVLATTQLHHESDECMLRELACPNKCGRTVRFLDVEEHTTAECSKRPTLCSLGCGRKVPLHTMETHLLSECRRRVVKCSLCGQQNQDAELAHHQAKECAQRLSTCSRCGQSDIAHAVMAHHKSDECRMRVVTCRFNCYATTPLLAHAKRHHEQFECACRHMFCPLGCGETIVAHTLKQHEKVCGMRIVVCGNGCGVELRERERAEHELRYCSAASGRQKRL